MRRAYNGKYPLFDNYVLLYLLLSLLILYYRFIEKHLEPFKTEVQKDKNYQEIQQYVKQGILPENVNERLKYVSTLTQEVLNEDSGVGKFDEEMSK